MSSSSLPRMWMLRAVFAAAGLVTAALPTLLAGTLRTTLDPARGNRIDPQKVLVIEVGCYLVAMALLALAVSWPWIVDRLDRLALRLRESHARRALRRRERSTPMEKALGLMFLGLVILLPLNLFLDQRAGLELAAEDGIIETGTAILYLLAAAANVLFAARFRGIPATRYSLYGLGALYFVVGMEEMSWGQRYLGVETPEALAGLNVQGEITLHNLWSTSINQALAIAVTFALLVVLPLLHRYWATARRLIDGIGFPVAPASVVPLYAAGMMAAVVIGLQLGTLGIGPRSLYGLQPHFDDEYLEFFLSFLFFVVAVGGARLELAPQPAPRSDTRGHDRTPDRLT